jgi:membrane-bound serine protease (ClpP class)
VGIGGGSAPEDEKGKSTDPGAQKAENMMAAFIESIAEQRKRNVEWAAKAVRESVAVTAEKALELGVIDIVASTRGDLLAQLGKHPFAFEGETVVLDVANASQRRIEMGMLTRVLNVIVDPNIAVLLLMAGMLGLYVEFNHPGSVLPGVAGATCLLLALIAMQILPFSWVGLLLIAAGIGLLIAEIFVTSYGLLFAAGIACFLIGGSMVFDRPDLSDLNVSFWPVLVPTVAGMALFGGLVVYAVGRTMGRRQESGVSELIGMTGVATTALDPEGTVFIRGEYWRARADAPIGAEERVEATAVQGMELRVRRARPVD